MINEFLYISAVTKIFNFLIIDFRWKYTTISHFLKLMRVFSGIQFCSFFIEISSIDDFLILSTKKIYKYLNYHHMC